MIQAILGALRAFGTRAAASMASAERGAVGALRKAATRDPEALAAHRRKPGKFPMPRTPIGKAIHVAGEIGQASWGVDTLANRFSSSAPMFSEMVNVKVFGERWASVQDLYVLAMSVVVCRVNGRAWQGAQGIRATVDVTGKYVEVEFHQAKKGVVEGLVSFVSPSGRSPYVLFHDPDWLTNEVRVLGKAHVIDRIPDLMTGVSGGGLSNIASTFLNRDTADADLVAAGAWTVNRVANQGPDGSQDGMVLVTHARTFNGGPVADQTSRGTDLTAIVTQALHDPCVAPPLPATDRMYKPDSGPDPGGCRTYKVTPGLIFTWLAEAFQNTHRYLAGWAPAKAVPDAHGNPTVGPPRPFGPEGC